MALTDVLIRKTSCPADKKQIKKYDAKGLFMVFKYTGKKVWRYRFTLAGKEKLLTLGDYPSVSLKDARKMAQGYSASVLKGIDPAIERAKEKRAELMADETKRANFEVIAREWLAHVSEQWVNKTKMTIKGWLETDIFPVIGGMPIDKIEAPDVLMILRRVDAAGHAYKVRKLHSIFSRIFSFAISHGKAKRNPARDIVIGDLFKAEQRENRPAFTTATDAGRLMRMISGYEGSPLVRDALKLLALVFARPGELRQMKWQEIDFDRKQWRYHVTKTDIDHIVPLSDQALAILEGLKPISGQYDYVFPGARSVHRALSNNTLNAALRNLGIDTKHNHCAHGFRAMARTLLAEKGWNPEYIERQLCHKQKDQTVAAYAREKHLSERTKMMQSWADYLDALRDGAQVIPIKRTA
jgi:integrase